MIVNELHLLRNLHRLILPSLASCACIHCFCFARQASSRDLYCIRIQEARKLLLSSVSESNTAFDSSYQPPPPKKYHQSNKFVIQQPLYFFALGQGRSCWEGLGLCIPNSKGWVGHSWNSKQGALDFHDWKWPWCHFSYALWQGGCCLIRSLFV